MIILFSEFSKYSSKIIPPLPNHKDEYFKFKDINVWSKWKTETEQKKLEYAIEIGFKEYVYWVTWRNNEKFDWEKLLKKTCKYGDVDMATLIIENGAKNWNKII